MILVTGASGKTGRAVVAALARAGLPARALVRHAARAQVLADLGAHEVVEGDLRLAADLRRAVDGTRAVYHICPNIHPDEVAIGQRLLTAAKEERVDLVVLHSVLHPQTEGMPHHWSKLRVEEGLIDSGLAFTILQPAPYMQNLLSGGKQIAETGVLRNPYPVETSLSLVDLQDVAVAAAKVLGEATIGRPELVGTSADLNTSGGGLERVGSGCHAGSSLEAWGAAVAAV
jgi:uncharacterized protein YbjT (DUF2867 family)